MRMLKSKRHAVGKFRGAVTMNIKTKYKKSNNTGADLKI